MSSLRSIRTLARQSSYKIFRRKAEWAAEARVFGARFPEFDDVVRKIKTAGTNSLSNFRNDYALEGGLRLQQNPEEFACLVLLLRSKRPIKKYFEIGTASGGTVLFLSREVGFGEVISMDNGQHEDFPFQEGHLSEIPNVRRFIGDSHSEQARSFMRETFPKRDIDVAFIDGDHSRPGVALDLEMTLPYCKRGALVVFHDTVACSGVDMVWRDALASGKLEPIMDVRGSIAPLGIAVGSVR